MTTDMPLAIEASGLVKTFGDKRAVDGVDLAVPSGAVYGVLGPNGAGKTTTIRMLATLISPDAGSARVFGHDVVREADAVRGAISLTGQLASVDEELTGRENLILLARLLGHRPAAARERADELLAAFGLEESAGKLAKHYSGGMRRRLDIAASIVVTPRLLILDEPTTGLDPRSRNHVWEIVRLMVAAGTTILLCTQYLEEADQLADGIAVIDRGRVIAEGTPAQLKASVGVGALQPAAARPGPAAARAGIARAADRQRPPGARPGRAVSPLRRRRAGGRGGHGADARRHRRRGLLARPAEPRRGLPRAHRSHRRGRGRRHRPDDRGADRMSTHATTSGGDPVATGEAPARGAQARARRRRPPTARRRDDRRPRLRLARPAEDPPRPRAADGRDRHAGALHGDVHLHVRRRDRRLDEGVPAVHIARHRRAVGDVHDRLLRRRAQHGHDKRRRRPLPLAAAVAAGAAGRRRRR